MCIISFFLLNISLSAQTNSLLKIVHLTNESICTVKQNNKINILLTKSLSLKLRNIHANNFYYLKSLDDKNIILEIPKDSVTVGKKYLTIRLHITKEIPEGSYAIEISSKNFSAVTESFKYLKPIIVKGFTKDLTNGIASVRNINGNEISLEKTFIESDGTFEIEINKERISSNNEPFLVNIRGKRDLNSIFTLSSFNFDSEIIVNDISTIIANLIKNKKDLTLSSGNYSYRVLNEIKETVLLKDSGNENCDISKFASLCSTNDNKTIGIKIKEFIQTTSCQLSQSIKNFIFKTSDEEVGKAFCESQKLPICNNGQKFTVDIPCNCANDSTLNDKGICSCPKGQSYT